MRFINYFLILIITVHSIESVRIRRKFRRQNNNVNETATNETLLQQTEMKTENVTEIFVTVNPKKFSGQKEIESLVDTLNMGRITNNNRTKYEEVEIQENVKKASEKVRIINVEIERHSVPKTFELECKFGNFSDYLSIENQGRYLYTCESFNLRVMTENTVCITSVLGEHEKSMGNHNVVVLRNIFSKSIYLPNNIANFFPNLLHLYVPSSRLKFINRRNFVGMMNLHTLDIRYNEIETLPNDVFLDLFNLEILSISGNFLKRLPPNAFVNLHNLRYIDVSDNEILIFDDEILSSNLELEEILFDHNRIKSIKSNFERFKDIGFIDLRGNVCIDTLYLKDHPDYPLLFEFQEEINYNCTRRDSRDIKLLPGTANIKLNWELCSKLKLPASMINGKMCLTERKNN